MVFTKALELAQKYQPEMSRFLRDMIALPSESGQEEKVDLKNQGRDGKGGLRQSDH